MADLVVFAKPPRSTALIILCVITVLVSSYYIFSNIRLYNNAAEVARVGKQQIDRSRAANIGASGKQDRYNKVMEDALMMLDETKLRQQAVGLLAGNLLTLVAAIIMFTQRPWGFGLYVAGSLLHIGTPLCLFGVNTIPGIISAVAQSIFSVAFVIMYAFQLKDMRPREIVDDLML